MKTPTDTYDPWTPGWVQHVTQGRWLSNPTHNEQAAGGLSIDSRCITTNQIFLAVRGEQFDGHNYVDKALNAGAAFAIVDQADDGRYPETGVLLVDDTVEALQRIARVHRTTLKQAGCRVIAVVGSNGKTTTRHLIHAVLSSHIKGTQSPKSFNNHLGVPLTLIGASPKDDFLVAEVGTNHPGEIDALGALLQPDSAVITCIGNEHMEFFKNLKGVAEEEAAITQYLPSNGNVFIEAEAHAWVRQCGSFNTNTHVTLYGHELTSAPPDATALGEQPLHIDDTTIELPLIAPHDRLNALAAVRVGQAMGVPIEKIKYALEHTAPMPGRLEVKTLGTVTLIDDSYNANPDSTLAALEVFTQFPMRQGGRRVAILADMLELGDLAEPSHDEVGQVLSQYFKDNLIYHAVLVGPLMKTTHAVLHAAHPTDQATHHPHADPQALQQIADTIRPNDLVLLKGSRGMQLERLLPILEAGLKR